MLRERVLGIYPNECKEVVGTQAEVLAASAPNGVYGVCEDTGAVLTRAGGVWVPSATLSFATKAELDAAVAANGGQSLGPSVSVAGVLWGWDGTRYVPLATNRSAEFLTGTSGSIILLSESILAVGNFPAQLASATGRTVDSSIAIGGSHIGTSLAAVSDESYSYGYNDNACPYSDDLTASGWVHITDNDCAVEKSFSNGGEAWSKMTNTSGAAGSGMRYIVPIPASGDSINVLAEFSTVSGDISPGAMRLSIRKMDGLVSLATATVNVTKTGKNYTACASYNKSLASSLFGTGRTIAIELRFDKAITNAVAYVRNATISFRNPTGFSPLVKTNGSAVVGTLGLKRHNKQAAQYKYACAVASFGRNECNALVPAKAHANAYKALIRAAHNLAPHVVPTNPPCRVNANVWDEPYYGQEYSDEFRKLCVEVGVGLDIHAGIQQFDPADVMTISGGFSQHENDAGAAWMVQQLVPMIEGGASRSPNNISPVRTYWDGVRSGSWTQLYSGANSLRRKRYLDAFSSSASGIDAPPQGASSSTSGDTISFSVDPCEQLYVLMDHGTGFGTFTVSVDGVIVATLSGDQTVASPSMISKYICDGLEKTSHTVVVTVISGIVRVHGLVTI